jgi:malate synthase
MSEPIATSSLGPMYTNMISPKILALLLAETEPVEGLEGLKVSRSLKAEHSPLETIEALRFICQLYERTCASLDTLLEQRLIDRAYLDAATQSYVAVNRDLDYLSPDYHTVLGLHDQSGRLLVGSYAKERTPPSLNQVQIPNWLKGDQVTLFGPPDTEKMSINAMNTLHHRQPNEAAIVTQLVDNSGMIPRWGADSEDSKTPILSNLLKANENLRACFDRTISYYDERKDKHYRLADTKLATPIKRIPGLSLPDGLHFWHDRPLPLHLYDFALHLFHNYHHPEALTFYIPKLENEEEAQYIQTLIDQAERMIQEIEPTYQLGTVKLFIVFENPRAIFRIQEIAQVLSPYFVGGSLGWHDFLASTARLFKNDPRYQIPVKADPYIVINHIKESHLILRDALAPLGGIAIGGMYGTLYEDGNPASYEVSMVGYIKDVCTQMKRGLDGFWVAHPNFVRIGIALVYAWRLFEQDQSDLKLKTLIEALVPNKVECAPLLAFVFGKDVEGLPVDHPLYQRGVLAADIETSDLIANSDEVEVRYNIFQALQYLTDWLCGNGCVALPAQLKNAQGDPIFVRVMDDLATTERSRWELWAEVHHQRVSPTDFEQFLDEEVAFIKAGIDQNTKKVQVKWSGDAARWYPVAIECLKELVLSPTPVESVPEIILPFTFDLVRAQEDPWAWLQAHRES